MNALTTPFPADKPIRKMVRTRKQYFARWLCLISFLLAGPLEGDEVEWGPFASSHVDGNRSASALVGVPQVHGGYGLQSDDLDRAKDPTVDTGSTTKRGGDSKKLVAIVPALFLAASSHSISPRPACLDPSIQLETFSQQSTVLLI